MPQVHCPMQLDGFWIALLLLPPAAGSCHLISFCLDNHVQTGVVCYVFRYRRELVIVTACCVCPAIAPLRK